MSDDTLSAQQLLALLQTKPHAHRRILYTHSIPAQSAAYSTYDPVPGGMFPQLYTHQGDVLEKALQKEHVVLATATASGKTFATALPYLTELRNDPNARLLCIAPTRALVEQWGEQLTSWCPGVLVKTYTTNLSDSEKRTIRQQAQVVVITPDMFHMSMLPYHQGWSTFYHFLRYVIIDESHMYRGVFGTHMALILHRFRRILSHYRETLPIFLFATATIGNPKEHAKHLLRQPVEAITQNGAPSGGRLFVLWQPHDPLLHSDAAAELMAFFVNHGVRTLLFGQQRQSVERMAKMVQLQLPEQAKTKVMAYRSGYLPEQRKAIQDDLVSGKLLGGVSTNALELGINIGHLKVAILDGFPGSVSSLWQQAGRAGRGTQSALVVLVLRENALDQYFAAYPDRLFEARAERALLNTQNPYILRSHIHCAAKEFPLTRRDIDEFGQEAMHHVEELVRDGHFIKEGNTYHLQNNKYSPAYHTAIRQIGEPLQIVDEQGKAIEDAIDHTHAIMECYPGAIYLSRGMSYRVQKLDLEKHRVTVQSCEVSYYTEPLVQTEIEILKTYPETTALPHARVFAGEVDVKRKVHGYTRRQNQTHVVLRTEELKEPLPLILRTQACWVAPDEELMRQALVRSYDALGCLHATEHAMIAFLPLFILGDSRDMGGLSLFPKHPQTQSATFFLYDGYPGGIGYAQEAFHLVKPLARATLEALVRCPCEAGCYACIQSPQCGSKNANLDKAGAIFLLRVLLGDIVLR